MLRQRSETSPAKEHDWIICHYKYRTASRVEGMVLRLWLADSTVPAL